MKPLIAMITARSTSSRFPKKHLASLGGKPMIVQIIDKLKKVEGLHEIVLATTNNPEDDTLTNLCEENGVIVIRGHEKNLAARHGLVLNELDPEAIIDVSGDCPFIDKNSLRFLVDAIKRNPGYDSYGITGPLCDLPGLFTGAHSFTWYRKAFQLFSEYHTEYSPEQYWLASSKKPERFSVYTIDGSYFIDRTVTPMKLSIDWNIERLFWNKIIESLGYFPETIDDINKAFTKIGKL